LTRDVNVPREIMKMQYRVIKGFLDHQALQGHQDPWGLRDRDFLVHREREVNQECPATQA
jgi:hypothetical protein